MYIYIYIHPIPVIAAAATATIVAVIVIIFIIATIVFLVITILILLSTYYFVPDVLGMNIQLPPILGFTRGTGFWPVAIYDINTIPSLPFMCYGTLWQYINFIILEYDIYIYIIL